MNRDQIDFLKNLDSASVDGTIQSVLMREDITKVSFENVAKFLLTALVQEKAFLIQDNISLSHRINKLQEEDNFGTHD